MGAASQSRVKATSEMYPELQKAYDHFNTRLFSETLPPCLITLNRLKRTKGYFSPQRFVRHDGQITHEIAMNPAYFACRSLKETLSTLVHEQVHLWQEVWGKPSRRGFHNGEWAARMESVGLMPSSTGEPGGKRIGEKITHYIIEGGQFDHVSDELLADGFRLSWLDRFPEAIPLGADIPSNYEPPVRLQVRLPEGNRAEGAVSSVVSALTVVGGGGLEVENEVRTEQQSPIAEPRLPKGLGLEQAAPVIVWPSDRRLKAYKSTYCCPGCGDKVWGKGGMELKCVPCDRVLLETA